MADMSDDRIVKSILAAGVLIAMSTSNAAFIDDEHQDAVVKSVEAWVRRLWPVLFGGPYK
jgi:hypothetical protein